MLVIPSLNRMYRPCRSDLIEQCMKLMHSLTDQGRVEIRDVPDSDDSNAGQSSDSCPRGKLLTLSRTSTVNFDWWKEEVDVLTHYDVILPRQVMPSPTILSQPKPQLPESSNKKPRVYQQDHYDLPRLRISRGPTKLDKPPFPNQGYCKVSEGSAAAIADYMSRDQNDDSIDLGLRIIAQIHQKSTLLTVIPSTRMWNILRRTQFGALDPKSEHLELAVKDIRQKTGPYMNHDVGLSAGLTTMRFESHWYVIFLLGVDSLVKCLQDVMASVGTKCSESCNSKEELMKAYSEAVALVRPSRVTLAVIGSNGISLQKEGWDMLQKFVFMCVLQSLSTMLNTTECVAEVGRVANLDVELQEFHLTCVSLQAATHIIWPFRIQLLGPNQSDGRIWGSYGLAAIWKLCSTEGLSYFLEVVQDHFKVSGRLNLRRKMQLRSLDTQKFLL